MVCCNKQGKLFLQWAKDIEDDVNLDFFQAGPFIIDPGHQKGIKKQVNRRFKRIVLANTLEGDIYIFAIGAADLMEICSYLYDFMPKLDRALNLDGGPSAMLVTPSFKQLPEKAVPFILQKIQSQ